MKFWSESFGDGKPIPEKYAFGKPDPEKHCIHAENNNPQFMWEELPEGTESVALICVDPDVPTLGDDVNQEGKSVPANIPRTDFYHWVLIDIPPEGTPVIEGEFSSGVVERGKDGPDAPRGTRQGVNDYTGWFANDEAMKGTYYGYDGPCPPWNDTIPHRYQFNLYALDVEKLDVGDKFTGPEALKAMDGHILGEASWTGIYSLNPEVKL